jgi:hypothetical protein
MTDETQTFEDRVAALTLQRYRAKTGVPNAARPIEGKSGLASVRLWQALERDAIEEIAGVKRERSGIHPAWFILALLLFALATMHGGPFG